MKKIIKKIVLALALSLCTLAFSAGDEAMVDSSAVIFPTYGDAGYKLAVKKTENLSSALPNLDEKAAGDLVAGKMISFGSGSGEDLTKYVPASSAAAKKLAASPQGKKGFAVVSCALIPYPASWKNMSADEKRSDAFRRKKVLRIFPGARAINRKRFLRAHTTLRIRSIRKMRSPIPLQKKSRLPMCAMCFRKIRRSAKTRISIHIPIPHPKSSSKLRTARR